MLGVWPVYNHTPLLDDRDFMLGTLHRSTSVNGDHRDVFMSTIANPKTAASHTVKGLIYRNYLATHARIMYIPKDMARVFWVNIHRVAVRMERSVLSGIRPDLRARRWMNSNLRVVLYAMNPVLTKHTVLHWKPKYVIDQADRKANTCSMT